MNVVIFTQLGKKIINIRIDKGISIATEATKQLWRKQTDDS